MEHDGGGGGDQVYEIPNATRSTWQKYSPDSQTRRIAEMDRRVGPRFTQLIRAIKWWSKMNGQPVRSHEIEILASEVFETKIPELPEAVAAFFDVAINSLQESSHSTETANGNGTLSNSAQIALSKLHPAPDIATQARH